MALPTASLFGFRLSLRPMSSHDHLLCLCGTGPAACLDPLFPRNTQCAGLSSWVALGILITTAKPHLQIQLPSGVPGAGLGHVNLRGHSLAHRTPRRDLCKSRAGGWGGAFGSLGSHMLSAVPWVLEVSSSHVVSLVVPNMTWLGSGPSCSYGAVEGREP